MELDTAVLSPVCLRLGVRHERPGGTEALRDQALLGDLTSTHEVTDHRVGAQLRQPHVELETTRRVTVSLDTNDLDVLVRVHDLRHIVEERE